MRVDVVTSPGGIKAWLVEDHFIPTFALQFAFEGGSAQDPNGKSGLAYLFASALSEARGPDALTFAATAYTQGLRESFYVRKDAFGGVLEALTENRYEAAGFLRAVLGQPPVMSSVLESVRQLILSSAGFGTVDPRFCAFSQWDATAFAGHPYAYSVRGTPEGLRTIRPDDLDSYRRNVIARDTLKVVAVGAISAEELGGVLDEAFGGIPKTGSLKPVAHVTPAAGVQSSVDLAVAQSTVVFGAGIVSPGHPDYAAALVVNQILGGRQMASRLVEEIRVKRGLAYEAHSGITTFCHASVLRGVATTANAKVGQVLDLVRGEFQRLADGDFGRAEVESAKRWLIAMQTLSLEDNRQVAWLLLAGALAGLGPDHLDRHRELVDAVTPEAARRVAGELLDPKNLVVSIAGGSALRSAAG